MQSTVVRAEAWRTRPSGREQADSAGCKATGKVREGGAEGPSPDLACRPTAERGKTLVQKKPTMYPEWRSTFDAHVYEGRVIQVVLMRAAEEPLSEATVGVSVLAERCKKNNGKAEFWVRSAALAHSMGGPREQGGPRAPRLQPPTAWV